MRDKVASNKKFMETVQHYKQKFGMKTLRLNARNLEYWLKFRSPDVKNPRYIEHIILEKQRMNFELTSNIN